MAGINNVGQSGLSYIDQLKSLQENKKTEESTGKQDLKQEDFLSSMYSYVRLSIDRCTATYV